MNNKELTNRLEALEEVVAKLEQQLAKVTIVIETIGMLFDQQRAINDQQQEWRIAASEVINKHDEFLFPVQQPKWEN